MPIPLGILAVAGAGAAGAANSFDLLTTTLITSNTASVTFSSLNTYTDYKHLQIRATFRTTDATALDAVDCYFNGVNTGTTYYRHLVGGSGSTVISSSQTAGASIAAIWTAAGNTATANTFTAGILDIYNFSSASINKTVRGFAGHSAANTTIIRLTSGFRNTTDALTSITLIPNSGTNFPSGCRFSLYGIKG